MFSSPTDDWKFYHAMEPWLLEMAEHYLIILNADGRTALEEITRTGVRAAKARALLLLDRNADSVKRWAVASMGEALGMTARTLEHLKERFVKYGLDAAFDLTSANTGCMHGRVQQTINRRSYTADSRCHRTSCTSR